MEEEICSAKKKSRDLTVDLLTLAGKEPVRDKIILTPKDALKKKPGKAMFAMTYRVNNEGFLASKDFENVAYFNDKAVSKQQSIALGPNDSKVMKAKVALDIKDGPFLVRIDAFSRITEDDETNNDITADLIFKGFTEGTKAVPALHIEYLRIASRVPVQGRIRLQKKQSVGQKKGRHAFPFEYVIRNYGIADATDFDIGYLLNGKRFFKQPNISLKAGESKLMKLDVYLPPQNGKLTIKIDTNNKYPKGADCKQAQETQVYFQGFTRA